MSHMWHHPPRCIREVAVVVEADDRQACDVGHECATHFWIQPNEKVLEAYTVYGRGTRELPTLVGPVRVGSLKSERAVFEFDPAVDGWDGEGQSPERLLKREAPRLRQFACPECKGRLFRLRAAFEYPLDDELADDPAAWARRQDWFTWFWLVGHCASCEWVGVVAEAECG